MGLVRLRLREADCRCSACWHSAPSDSSSKERGEESQRSDLGLCKRKKSQRDPARARVKKIEGELARWTHLAAARSRIYATEVTSWID
jgi:hypothetical protein